MTRPTFEAKGTMTIRAVCIEVIQRIKPKEGVSYAQALDDVRELTGLPELERLDIMGAMNQASKDLRALGEPGATNRRRVGWERETEDGMVVAGERHERKAQRQVRWAVSAVAEIAVEKLSWESRSRREGVIERNRRVSELEARRAARKRPREVESA